MGVGEICISLTVSLQSTLIYFSKKLIYWVIVRDNISGNTVSFGSVCHCVRYYVMLFNHFLSFLAIAKIARVSTIVKPTKLLIKISLNG